MGRLGLLRQRHDDAARCVADYQKHSAVTVRNHLLATAQRAEQWLGDERAMFMPGSPAERDQLPIPDGPLSVGLDGGIVRARRDPAGKQPSNHFEVIAGKSILAFHRDDPDDVPPSSKCFTLVQSVDTKPKRRLFELLQSQGMQVNQQVTFFSDGGDTVRALPEYLHPEADHILDWFHLTVRRVIRYSIPVRDGKGSEGRLWVNGLPGGESQWGQEHAA